MNAHSVSLQNCHLALYFDIKHVDRPKNAQYKLELKCLLLQKKELHGVQQKSCVSEAGSSLLRSSCSIH